MRSPNRVDTSTLGWVKNEIDQTLSEARDALQRYVDSDDDLTPLRLFANSVHQVAGTLQMVELDGAAQLAQETESLASAVVAGKIDGTSHEVANELLGQGLNRLSSYMERLASGRPDRPIDNVEVINELRRARQAEELEPFSLFHPDLEVYPAREKPVEEVDREQYTEQVRELRSRYQAALLKWLRDQSDEDSRQVLADAVAELYALSRYQVSMQIWWVARAYLDVLKTAELSRDDPRKHALSSLDQLMRKLTQESEAAIAREGSEKLVRYMLYHIGRSGVRTDAIQAVSRVFELDALLGEETTEPELPDAVAIAALAERATEPLRAVQSTLDHYSRTGEADLAACDQHLREISQAARESGVVELGEIADGVHQLLFGDDGSDRSEEALLAAARALLFTEETLHTPESVTGDWRQEAEAVRNRLAAYAASDRSSLGIESHEIDTNALDAQELKRLIAAVAGQVEDNLKQAEQNLERYSKDTTNTDSLSAVLGSLRQVHGAVRMLGQHKLCDLLEMTVGQIRALIDGEAYPTDALLDALAVTIGTADAYVKGIERESPNTDALLNWAMEELEGVVSGNKLIDVDPVETLQQIQESFAAWIGDNLNYEAFRTLRQSLRDIGALAHQQEQLSARRIAQEMTNLLDIVTDDPTFLSEEVEGTLHKSLAALGELAVSLKRPDVPEPVPQALSPAAEGSDEDDEVLRETFAEEAEECLRDIETSIETLSDHLDNQEALADLRRSFHTIKGSGRMAKARDIAELAWVVEDVLNRCLDGDVPLSESIIAFASRARGELHDMLGRGLDSATDLSEWRQRAAGALQGQEPQLDQEQQWEPEQHLEPEPEREPSLEQQSGQEPEFEREAEWGETDLELDLFDLEEETAEDASASPVADSDSAVDGGFGEALDEAVGELSDPDAVEAPEGNEQVLQSIEDLGDQGHSLAPDRDDQEVVSPFSDEEVIKIFSKEALSHIATIRSTVDECNRDGRSPISDELLRAVHTLQGNSRSLHLVEMSEAYTALDSALHRKKIDDAGLEKTEMPVLDALLVATAKVLDHLNRDKRFPEVVRKELADLAAEIDESWTAAARASTAGNNPLDGLELASNFVADSAFDETSKDAGAEMEEQDHPAEEPGGSVFDQLVETPGTRSVDDKSFQLPEEAPVVEPPVSLQDYRPQEPAVEAGDADIDDTLRDVFMEEAADILSRFESDLQQGRRNGLDSHLTNTLKRELHTLKGSSRAAGMEVIGDLSHDAETMLEGVGDLDDAPADLLETLEEVHDTLANLIHALEAGRSAEPDPRLVKRLRGGPKVEAAPEESESGQEFDQESDKNDEPAVALIPEEGTSAPEGAASQAVALPRFEVEDHEAAKSVTEPETAVEQTASEETTTEEAVVDDAAASEKMPIRVDTARPTGRRATVRIHSNVLDRLVNYAGEVSISRAQLEEQLSGLKGNLNELRANVARFSDQVRELDIQADTQIRARVAEESVSDPGHDFDPLELDRYSRLQQLSRSLSESVDDLVTIQAGLNRFASQTEGVLSQQALLNSELQDGLMSARMVPFNTMVPRLRHSARQTARELNKDVDFTVAGGELEVDRNILDQLSEALEHMIRNSLDHGIESAEARRAAGKPVRGSIRIDCRQEGNEVVLKFSDDGAGLDVEKIKIRAVEAGLMTADSVLNDDEVIQLIVLSGFSTARTVTQLSGRGVGLDVVNDAVRHLGGGLSMENRPGQGVSFQLRLPLSLSITQAMFVRCGDQRFAIPLGVIETVLKTEPGNLVELSKDGDPVYRQDDRVYPLMDLTGVLGLEQQFAGKRVSVLLVRMGAREIAVRVDELVGTDEIVVKQLGDYLGHLSGINGATITGDGSVVLILDIADLWLAQERLPAFKREVAQAVEAPTRVMVVDDSLTVRKVTGRNLGRRGMEVMMARDGIDALDQLAKVKPDLMLVDIEMPRMDGYELTRQIREDVNYRDIPIIVITSRAGTKHRERAMELGANAYLTKPYQEQELLDEVTALLNSVSRTTVH